MPRNPTNVEVTMSDQATNRADVGLDLSPKIGFLFIHKSWVLMENLTENSEVMFRLCKFTSDIWHFLKMSDLFQIMNLNSTQMYKINYSR